MSPVSVFDPGLTPRWRPAVEAHKAHAVAEWPREACGLIDLGGDYHPVSNVASDPVHTFELDGSAYLDLGPDNVAAVLHSHTSGEGEGGRVVPPLDAPSAADMRSQMDMAVPWGITLCLRDGASDPFWFGDQVPRPPLLGRSFRHGVDDCYALIRDWHQEAAGIPLPDYPRDEAWWEDGGELYGQFADAGFSRVQRDREPAIGDVFLCRVRSPVHNHGGIYIGGGLILHHLSHQLSMRSPASVWRTKLDFLVRHRDLPEGWAP